MSWKVYEEGEQNMKPVDLQGTIDVPRKDYVNEMREAIALFVIARLTTTVESDNSIGLMIDADELNAIARLADVVTNMPTCVRFGDSD